jgi:hypothetical protein
MNIGKSRLLIGVFLACGLSAQEGDIVQKEKAQRDKQLKQRNAQPKTPQPTQPDKTQPQADSTPPADPSTVGTAGRKKKSETARPKPENPPQ